MLGGGEPGVGDSDAVDDDEDGAGQDNGDDVVLGVVGDFSV